MMEEKRLLNILLVCFCTFVVFSSALYGKGEDRFEIILPSGVMQLYAPINIKDVLYYKDGGTIGIIIQDKNGTELQFCLDGRIRVLPSPTKEDLATPEKRKAYLERGKKIGGDPRHIYVGATHPEHEGAKEIPIGGKEEKSLLKLLQAWVDGQLSLEGQEKLLNAVNLSGIMGLSEEEIKVYRILRVIKTIKNR